MEEIKNLQKAAQRIKKAIKQKERILLFGDSDLDGTTSVILLQETIESFGGKVTAIYFPNRDKEGYGLQDSSLKFFRKYAPALLCTLDCGIGNVKSLAKAKKMHFDTLVIDHHEVLEKLPPASIIVDPKQTKGDSNLKALANVGVTYKLCQALFNHHLSSSLKQSFLELVALGTLADKMPEVGDNKIFIREGLNTFPQSFREGIKTSFEIARQSGGSLREVVSRMISALNITPLSRHLTGTYEILTKNNPKEVRELAEKLFLAAKERQAKIRKLTEEVENKVSQDDILVFQGNRSLPLILAGAVASRICNRFQKPVFVYHLKTKESIGSVRVPRGVDSVEAMRSCRKLLKMYGGHPAASGFTVENKNLKKFKHCLEKYFQSLQK